MCMLPSQVNLRAAMTLVQAMNYAWVEGYSEEHSRPFFYNQETKESVWSRPVDLAWQRVPVKDEL